MNDFDVEMNCFGGFNEIGTNPTCFVDYPNTAGIFSLFNGKVKFSF